MPTYHTYFSELRPETHTLWFGLIDVHKDSLYNFAKDDGIILIIETSPRWIGNLRKFILYNCFMS